MKKIMYFVTPLILMTGCNIDEKYKDTSRAYYGDFDSGKVFSINLDSMKLESTTNGGFGAYGLEAVGNNFLVSLTRKDTSVDIINAKKRNIVHTIELGYQPREVATSPSGKFSVISGRDIPAHTLINVKTGLKLKSYDTDLSPVKITDFGGQNATGHPFFVSEYEYLILDRVNREIRLYNVYYGLLDTLKTATSTHHILRKGNYLFVALEGSGSSEKVVSPGVLKLSIKNSKINLVKTAYLASIDSTDTTGNNMGIHHINFHYDGNHIYTGSNNGYVYVVNSTTMEVVDSFKSGKGGGHLDFVPKRKIAMVTNHKSPFVTMVDVRNPRNNKIIKHIPVSDDKDTNHVLQGHTQCISDDGNRFYGAATSDGKFFEIKLKTKSVTRTLDLDGADLQQGFMYQSPEGGFANPQPKFIANSVFIQSAFLWNKALTGNFAKLQILKRDKNQAWDVQMRTKDTFHLKNRETNECLTEKSNGFVSLSTCNNKNKKQIWSFEKSIGGKVFIQNVKTSHCLKNVANIGTKIGECSINPIYLWHIKSAY